MESRAREKEEFEEEVEQQINGQSIIVVGDMNAHVGSERRGYENVMGREGRGNRNKEGKNFLEFCRRNGLVVGNSYSIRKSVTR